MIIARIESLILERGMEDALARAAAYVEAGADGIMIHSRKKDPAEILEFCDRFRAQDPSTPIVVVPTSFNVITEEELAARRAEWQPREPKVTDGYLKRYASLVTSGNRGAILETR